MRRTIHCKYCDTKMNLAWPATDAKGSIMTCDRSSGGCGASCQTDGRKTWDWRPAKREVWDGLTQREI